MSHTAIVALGLVAGLHAALYGAYKDSPHESFLVRRFVREITIAFAVAVALVAGDLDHGQTPFILLVSVFALSRIVTESSARLVPATMAPPSGCRRRRRCAG